MSLFVRHILWTTLCPGTVTIILPWILFGNALSLTGNGIWYQLTGACGIIAGSTILISCIVMFGKFGKGTLSPFDPARHLVIKGLYRYVRNPMYVGVMIMLAGESVFFGSWSLFIYAVVVFAGFNLFVILYEEPFLRKEFGVQYDHYRAHVRRWIPGTPYRI